MNTGKIGIMLIALSLGLLVSAASVQAADDVVINEIMYAPSDAFGGTYNEWVELYNNDTVEVNITGWAIDGTTIPAVTMQPGDYAIIAKNDTKFADCYPDVMCTVVKATISLRNDGEVINLNDSSESVIDDADFTGCADLALKNNKTLELNAVGGWEASLVDGGTPCAENSVLDEGSSTLALAVSADPASVTVDAQTDVTFTVTSDDAAIENALVTLSGCGIDANGITGTDGTVVISVTATSAGTIDVTVTKDGYDDATTSVDATDDGGSPALAVSADPASVTVDNQTDVTFTVTSDDATIEGALVTLLGCGVDVNGTTGADGTLVISVTATSAGAIDVTVTKDGYESATTSVTAEDSSSTSVLSISDASVAAVGETATVNITADGVTDLANFDVTVTYDPAVVNVTDAANDVAFGVAVNNLEGAANGEVRLASLNFGDGQTGDGILLSTLTLEATGDGTTALTLTINELKDSAEGAITVSIDDGKFKVGDNVTPPLAVVIDPTSVDMDNQTDVTFTVTSDGVAIEGALVALSGCGVEIDGTTGANGTVTISVTATSAGTIAVTVTKDGYADATATITVKSSVIAPAIESAIASPNAILSDGNDSTTLTVVVTYLGDAPSVTVDLSAIGGSSEQVMETLGDLQAGAGTWTTTVSTTTEGTFELPVTVSDADGTSDTANIVLTAGPYKYTLNLKQGWNMVSLPYDITAVGIDTTQRLGDVITAAGETCYYVSQFNATSQRMESDIINPLEGMPQDTTYSIMGGQGYFIFVGDDLDFVVAGKLW